jgi:Baseplate J-like protein
MSGIWWGRDAWPPSVPRPARGAAAPVLMPADRRQLQGDFDARAPYFTPEWTSRRAGDDAGTALRQLFAEQLEAVVQRLDRWPDKALVEFLDAAGVTPMPGDLAEVLLQFEIDGNAPGSQLIGEGFQVGAHIPGADQIAIFETERSFSAAPGKIGEVYAVDGRTARALDPPFAPFGDGRSTTAQLVIGLTGAAAPSGTLSLGLGIAPLAGAPPPVPAGGVAPLPVPPGPALVWEILDGAKPVAVDVVRDETGGLMRSGIVELALPPQWRAGTPAVLAGTKSTRWLRLRIGYGRFAVAPQLSFIALNVARAIGAQTVRDEVPEPVPKTNGRTLQLSQTPVVADSLVLQVDDSGLQLGAAADQGAPTWTAVADLSLYGPDDAVYEIDLVSGQITFGDGYHGKALPEGFRNVHATSYRVQSAVPGPVDAGAVNTIVSSLEYLTKVSNPQPVTGGGPGESTPHVLKRGPQEIRTRDRAVTVADYALMALRAEGANIARAFAVPGLHPQYPGRPIPGVVGVFVVPPDRQDGASPTPDPETLRGVATWLAQYAAPAGIEVVAAAPRYKQVTLDVGLVLADGVDVGATVRAVLTELDTYLHPLTGGETGEGWPFGGTIRYVPLLRRITSLAGVQAVPRLNVTLDGLRNAACIDVPIAPYALLWPAGHQVFVLPAEATS